MSRSWLGWVIAAACGVAAVAGAVVALAPITHGDTYCGPPVLVPFQPAFVVRVCGDVAMARVVVGLFLFLPGLVAVAAAVLAWSRRRVNEVEGG